MKTLIIAEAGVNHNGSVNHALRLIDAACDAGADAVKFQSFRPELVIRPNAKTAEYQKAATGTDSQLEMVRQLQLSIDEHKLLADHCRDRGLEYMSTAFDLPSLEELLSLGVSRLKIGSGDITYTPLLRAACVTGLPIIVSTGMATLDEVVDAFGFVSSLSDDVTLLQCTSLYPTPLENVNLRAMSTIAKTLGCPVGFSDHTRGEYLASAAVAMGATIIEKHLTLSRMLPGPDHQASLEPAAFGRMVRAIRDVEEALGSGVKEPNEKELEVRSVARRSGVTANAVSAGSRLQDTDVLYLRPADGLSPIESERLIGKVARRDIGKGALLQQVDFS